mgnify:CR=1 FL=1
MAFSASIFPLAVKLPAIDNLYTLIFPPTVQRPATVELTCASVVNRLPDLVEARAGFVATSSMKDLNYKINI